MHKAYNYTHGKYKCGFGENFPSEESASNTQEAIEKQDENNDNERTLTVLWGESRGRQGRARTLNTSALPIAL